MQENVGSHCCFFYLKKKKKHLFEHEKLLFPIQIYWSLFELCELKGLSFENHINPNPCLCGCLNPVLLFLQLQAATLLAATQKGKCRKKLTSQFPNSLFELLCKYVLFPGHPICIQRVRKIFLPKSDHCQCPKESRVVAGLNFTFLQMKLHGQFELFKL